MKKLVIISILSFVIYCPIGVFAEVEVPSGYVLSVIQADASGDFDYLPNGDIIALTSSYPSLNLVIIDANGDGFPSFTEVLYEFDPNIYGSFVEVSPDGTFALVATTGASNTVKKYDFASKTLTDLFDAPGNFDLVFVDSSHAYLSANPGGWDLSQPNVISYVDLNFPFGMQEVVSISNTPSGPIGLSDEGDLYYVKSTWDYPAPSNSHSLLKFKRSDLIRALASPSLDESDSKLNLKFDSGSDVAVDVSNPEANKVYISSFSGEIFIYEEGKEAVELFANETPSDSDGSFVRLSLFKPEAGFYPYVYSESVLGVSYATQFYTHQELVQIATDAPIGTTDASGACVPGGGDCVYDPLETQACVGVNGFLEMVNIVSLLNLTDTSFKASIEYFDSSGARQGAVSLKLGAKLKNDIIVNDMGLEEDSYGTVCVSVDAPPGSWTGGVSLYKPSLEYSNEKRVFGDSFDFALYYPFLNPKKGTSTVPLNTFHLGTNPLDVVANWISVVDAKKDGERLKGELIYYSDSGGEVSRHYVDVPDGGRRDYAGHEGLVLSAANADAVGMVIFEPEMTSSGELAGYYLTATRYFYDCGGVACSNFLAAFVIPERPATKMSIATSVSAVSGAINVVELNNTTSSNSRASLGVFNEAGDELGESEFSILGKGTKHIILNKSGNSGYFEDGEVGASEVEAQSGNISALQMVYELNSNGVLLSAYAVPLAGSAGSSQSSQFNTFISHSNTTYVFNSGEQASSVSLRYVDVLGQELAKESFALNPKALKVFGNGALIENTFGTILLEADTENIVMSNKVSRPSSYTLSFPGQ